MARTISTLLNQGETDLAPFSTINNNSLLDLQEKVAVVRGLLRDCQPLTNQRQLFGNSLHSIAINTLPFIDTE
jgi:hypothetical protein